MSNATTTKQAPKSKAAQTRALREQKAKEIAKQKAAEVTAPERPASVTKGDVRKGLDKARAARSSKSTEPKAPRERKPSTKAKPVTYDAKVRYPGWDKHAKALTAAGTDRAKLDKAIFTAVAAGYPVTLIGGHITMNPAQVHSNAVRYAKQTDGVEFPTLAERKAAREALRTPSK